VVVYFYPSAYTSGCNVQAHAFAVDYDKFAAAGATIIGVSLDSIARLNDFSKDPEYCNSKFPVASDADGRIAKSYDLVVKEGRAGLKDTRGVDIDHGFAERTTHCVARRQGRRDSGGEYRPRTTWRRPSRRYDRSGAGRSSGGKTLKCGMLDIQLLRRDLPRPSRLKRRGFVFDRGRVPRARRRA
jgi:hypothetical protein